MKIATWNVNSIRARLERVKAWLVLRQPDVLCVQETKVEDEGFPRDEFTALGYHASMHGQKTYNGVAILSRQPLTKVIKDLGGDGADTQARFLVGEVGGVKVGSLYVPNGQAVGSEKFAYKLAWLARWKAWVQAQVDTGEPWLFGGDFNIAPTDGDVYDPVAWKDQVLCHPQERQALAEVLSLGFVDLFKRFHPEENQYTWWDYRQLGFPKNRGLRIDHLLATPPLAQRCRAVTIDRDERKGAAPSDHAPVIAEFEDL
jgi:exodeoxyribonuclease-3